jgi:uncharacterized protein (DUF1778 family)
MGRPPKKPEDRKTYQLHVPLTGDQHALIKQAVEIAGADKAEWARAVLLDAAKRSIAKSTKGKPN